MKIQAPRALRGMADEESCPGSSSHLIKEPYLPYCRCLCRRSSAARAEATWKPDAWVLEEAETWARPRPDLQGWEGVSLVLPSRGLACLLLGTWKGS